MGEGKEGEIGREEGKVKPLPNKNSGYGLEQNSNQKLTKYASVLGKGEDDVLI